MIVVSSSSGYSGNSISSRIVEVVVMVLLFQQVGQVCGRQSRPLR